MQKCSKETKNIGYGEDIDKRIKSIDKEKMLKYHVN